MFLDDVNNVEMRKGSIVSKSLSQGISTVCDVFYIILIVVINGCNCYDKSRLHSFCKNAMIAGKY